MQVVHGLDRYPPDAGPGVVAQGTFDGVHLGHQDVIRMARARAMALRLPVVVVTFDPHPAAVLRPGDAPGPILPLPERVARIRDLRPDLLLVIPFTREFSQVEAAPFVRDVLLGLCRAREIVVGFNHTFGRGARGTPALLRELCAPAGVTVHVVAPHEVDGVPVSSSAIRAALRCGDVGAAARLLGRSYTFQGPVVRGQARGRRLGFPTVNVPAPPGFLLADGVYAGRIHWNAHVAPGVVNVGVRPTFGSGGSGGSGPSGVGGAGPSRVVEAHLLGVSPDLYDHTITMEFLARVRDERRFPSAEALTGRIHEDVREVRRLLGLEAPPD